METSTVFRDEEASHSRSTFDPTASTSTNRDPSNTTEGTRSADHDTPAGSKSNTDSTREWVTTGIDSGALSLPSTTVDDPKTALSTSSSKRSTDGTASTGEKRWPQHVRENNSRHYTDNSHGVTGPTSRSNRERRQLLTESFILFVKTFVDQVLHLPPMHYWVHAHTTGSSWNNKRDIELTGLTHQDNGFCGNIHSLVISSCEDDTG